MLVRTMGVRGSVSQEEAQAPALTPRKIRIPSREMKSTPFHDGNHLSLALAASDLPDLGFDTKLVKILNVYIRLRVTMALERLLMEAV